MSGIKRLVTILVVLSVGIIPCAAQAHYDSRVYFGAKGGADMSRVFFNPSIDQGFKPGIVAGVAFRYAEEANFGLLAELNFVQRGWTEKFKPEEDFSYQRTLNYVEIPVMAHIFFGRRGRFFFNAGPQIAFLLGESTKANFDYNDVAQVAGFPKTHRTAQYAMKARNKVDYGICAGLGGEFFVNPKNSLALEVRFYYGLGNIFSARRVDYFHASNQMSLAFTASYWFRTK